jgi:general secretion pathway protein G
MIRPPKPRHGFSLVELLMVITIIALLAALLFPVLGRARKQADSTACLSNLGQIGRGIATYMTDYDGLFPHAVDPSDKFAPEIWAFYPEFQARIPSMPFLHEVVQPYLKNPEAFKCPSDTGFSVLDSNFPLAFDARPTMYQKYGTSYFFRTEIAFRFFTRDHFELPASVNVLFDAAGHWHGDARALRPSDSSVDYVELRSKYRYNVLFGDWSVRNLTANQLDQAWMVEL